MITIFTTTKPFQGEIEIIQRNALLSWKKLIPQCEIVLFDNEQGSAEIAKELGIIHLPEVKKNEYGTPLISDIFERAQKIGKNKVLAYVNADIILMKDFLAAISKINLEKFLMVGRRWDLDIKERINFQNPNWEEEIKEKAKKEGILHGPAAIDYFVFPKGILKEIPFFALGRTAWDNWLLYNAWISDIPLIDATQVIKIIHQNHKAHTPQKHGSDVWKGPEAKINQKLAGGLSHAFTIRDASKILTSGGLKTPRLNLYRIFSFPFRYYEKIPLLKPILFPGWLAMLLWRKQKVSKN